jgi:ribulose-5-phosphate 4-epimerase/fuculose-1-phosphate aldolase
MPIAIRNAIKPQIRAVTDAWRILGQLGLVDTIFNHISATIADPTGTLQLVMNPEGRLPKELSTENMCVFPVQKYKPSEASLLGVNPDGLQLHSAMHRVRMKPGAIIHTHSAHCLAVGCSDQGLLPLSQTAIEFSDEVAVIEYGGMFRSQELTKRLINLATNGGIALLRNHGTLVVADSVAEAFYMAYFIEEACKIQVITLSQGVRIILPKKEAIADAQQAMRGDRAKAAAQLFGAFRRNMDT